MKMNCAFKQSQSHQPESESRTLTAIVKHAIKAPPPCKQTMELFLLFLFQIPSQVFSKSMSFLSSTHVACLTRLNHFTTSFADCITCNFNMTHTSCWISYKTFPAWKIQMSFFTLNCLSADMAQKNNVLWWASTRFNLFQRNEPRRKAV